MLRVIFRALGITKDMPKEVGMCINQLSEGLEALSEKNLLLAEAKFVDCVEVLENRGKLKGYGHNYILKRLALTQRGLGKFQACEESLEEVLRNSQEIAVDDFIDSAFNVIKQGLHSNLPRAVELGQWVADKIPSDFIEEFNFLYGTALVMNSEYTKGKELLGKSLEKDKGDNKAYILNNLACGQWWHIEDYKSADPVQFNDEEKKEFDRVCQEFKEAIPNFTKAIMHSERLTEAFDIDKHSIETPNCLISLNNAAEIYLQGMQYELCVKWLRKSIEVCGKTDKKLAGRPLTLLGVVLKYQKEKEKAEDVLLRAVKRLSGRADFSEFVALQIYGHFLQSIGKSQEAEIYLAKSESLQDSLFYWSERTTQLYLPTWHL